MSGPRFDETYTGREFYKVTLPGLVKQLERLNELLERLVEASEQRPPRRPERAEPIPRPGFAPRGPAPRP